MDPSPLSPAARAETFAMLGGFLHDSPSPHHAAANAAARLEQAGFRSVAVTDPWDDIDGAAYTVVGGSLVAWRRPSGLPASAPFRVIGAHTDSPNLRLKPRADAGGFGWRQLAVEVYGGALANSWLDRDLGVSGRLVLRDGTECPVLVDEAIARVPQLAIHLDRDVNDRGLLLDKQAHLTPVWGLGTLREGEFVAWIAQRAGVPAADVRAYDLMLHDLTPPALLGRDGELLASGRLDNLCSSWCAIEALAGAGQGADATQVVCLFDHEEVGSASTTGAGGPLLERTVDRLVSRAGGGPDERARALVGSRCVSSDMAHAVHPNYPERHEPGHRPLPNGGPVLKVNAGQKYATDAVSAAWWIGACEAADVPHQVFVSRNNQPCGSTIGPITATRLGIATVDVGCAQLSMHSARELCGADDPAMLTAALAQFLLR